MINPFPSGTLRRAVLTAVILPMLALVALASGISVIVTLSHETEHTTERLRVLARSSGLQIEDLLWELDYEMIERLADNLILADQVLGLRVTDDAGADIWAGQVDGIEDPVVASVPLRHLAGSDLTMLGTLTLYGSTSAGLVEAKRRALALWIVALISISLVTVAILALLHRGLMRPMTEIERALGRADPTQEDFSLPLSPGSNRHMIDELRRFIAAIHAMRAQTVAARGVISEKQEQLARAAMLAGIGHAAFDADFGRFLRCDENFAAMLGYTPDEMLDDGFQIGPAGLFPMDQTVADHQARIDTLRRGRTVAETYKFQIRSGEISHIRVIIEPRQDPANGHLTLEVVAQDITELKLSEERTYQAEKMQTIGKLTGGVAHDVNNILAIISGNLELIRDAEPGEDTGPLIVNGLAAVARGAKLTRHLLAFARKQPLSPVIFDPARRIRGVIPMLEMSAGPNVTVEVISDSGLWSTLADPNQLEAAVLNLVINARDAMPEGGALMLELSNVRIDRDYARLHSEVEPGQYVCLSVTDTGDGMEKDIVAQAFDPFFTTKPVGKGTGLGLSMVFGFAKQSGGHAKIYSEPGHGTTIKLYLPRAMVARPADDLPLPSGARSRLDSVRVFLIEDEPDLRALYATQLKSLGCQVETAADGAEALARASDIDPPDIILTDVVLTGRLNGKALASLLKQRFPQAVVVYMSGFTENVIIHDGKLDPGSVMLQKPFTLSELATILRDVVTQ